MFPKKINKLYIDIDEVVRDLGIEVFGYRPETWISEILKDGKIKEFAEVIDEDRNILVKAKLTEVGNFLKEYSIDNNYIGTSHNPL